MNPKTLRTLEFDKIMAQLTARAISPMGKETAAALSPMTDAIDIRQAQRETAEAVTLILRKSSLPLGGIQDIRAGLARAVVGGMLSMEELLHVCDFLYVCRKVLTFGHEDGKSEPLPRLQPYFDAVQTADDLEADITRCIRSAAEMADNASPKLNDLRRNIKVSNDRVREHLNGVLQSATYKTMLQDAIITIRNERFCVPVKAEHRAAFPGMVHDQSASGATLFMEPLSVVQLNNKIKELHFEEQKEIERILLKLSGHVAHQSDLLHANMTNLTYLDFVFAKAELALAMKATEPLFNTRGYINIKKGRHPLLNPDAVVPTDIYLGGDFSMLLITGPNTGGKTVSLKTVGLLTCMGQAGLHIPAFDQSELAVFDDVFADIGDEQSIEQSLSTFSSHMTNIVGILEHVTPNALVLLDELGAGTDPTEGAALAIAILEFLRARGTRCAVTTHYSELKLFALSTPGVENASCEFDVETLRPTYKLLIGIPGKSNAFAIAARLGLPAPVIRQAKEVLSQEDVRFEDMMSDLEISKKSVILEQERAEQYRREAEHLKRDFERQQDKLTAQKEKILREAQEEAARTVRRARDEADALVKDFRKQMQGQTDHRAFEAAQQRMREGLAAAEHALAPGDSAKSPRRAAPENLRRGDRVFIHSLNQRGTVSVPPGPDGETLVQAGIMKIKVPVGDLSRDDSEEKARFDRYAASAKARRGPVKPEADLRGMMVEEALEAADKYLDDVYLAGLPTVTLIHGKGTGALRKAVHARLKNHPHVKEYRLGKYGEGEDGVTVVSLAL